MRKVVVSKGLQGALLAAYTALLLGATLVVEGRPGVRTNLVPFDDVARIAQQAGRSGFLNARALLAVAGLLGNLALFAAWGFLAWKLVDGRDRPRLRTHLEVAFLGLVLSVGIETVQFFLPTRAADVNDVFWNTVGAIVGAVAAHLHASIELDWA